MKRPSSVGSVLQHALQQFNSPTAFCHLLAARGRRSGEAGSVLALSQPRQQSPCRGAARGAPQAPAPAASPKGLLARRYVLSSEHSSSTADEAAWQGG